MPLLADLSIVSTGFVAGLAAVALTALAATVFLVSWLPRRRLARTGRHAKDASGRRRILLAVLPAVLVCQLLVTGLAAARINTSLRFANTLGEAVELASGSGSSTEATQLAPVAGPDDGGVEDGTDATASATPDPAYVASLEPTTEGGNTFRTTFHGPSSDVTDDVWFWTPRDYSPTDSRTYNVLVFLHGVPGTADGIVPDLDLGTQVQAAIDDGSLPPTIVAVPSLNADATQRADPDCADVVGHARVGTWIQQDVPRMIRATFPSVRADREGWALGGVSSGGFCAVWTTVTRSDVYSSAISLSGYDAPDVGGLTSPQLRDSNTLSTMVAGTPHEPIGLWLMGADDDPLTLGAVTTLPAAVGGQDSAEVVRPAEGGHSWTLWKAQTPAFVSWWAGRPGVNPQRDAEATPSPSANPDDGAGGVTDGAAAGGDTAAAPAPESGPWHRLALSFTQIRGTGLIAVVLVLTLVATAACTVVPVLTREPEEGAQKTPREGATAAGLGRLPARYATAVGIAGRALLLVVACVLAAFLVGLVANRIGGFYPTWGVAWSDIAPALW